MSREFQEKKVTPFFKTQTPKLKLKPAEEMSTEKVWLQKEKLVTAILDSVNDGVFTIDFNMKITSFNRAAEKITGYSAQEAIGKLCMDVLCNVQNMQNDCLENCPMNKTLKHKTPITKKRMIYNKNGEMLIISATTNILLGLDDQPIGMVETFVDVTAFETLKEKWQGKKYNLGEIIGKSPKMTEIYEIIESINSTLASVLIQGETGTGKGLIARSIHYHSINHKGPFVHVNCAAVPEHLLESELFGHVKGAFTGAIDDRQGKFELAHRGTIFLDEICEMSASMQVKLLQVVERKEFERVGGSKTTKVNARIISATNCDIEYGIRTGKCRKDLFYRINTIPITLPPLRERTEDIPLLVEHFVDKFNFKMEKSVKKVAPEVLDVFMKYSWPGNVRELESVLEFTLIKCSDNYIDQQCLPPELRLNSLGATGISSKLSPVLIETSNSADLKPSTQNIAEHETILNALNECHWNRTKAAKQLNVSRTTLWRLMKKYKFT